jgi:hypothetical protein
MNPRRVLFAFTQLFIFVLPWRGAIVLATGLPVLSVLTLGKALGIVLGISWILFTFVNGEMRKLRGAPLLFVALGVWSIASITWAIAPTAALTDVQSLVLSTGSLSNEGRS